MGESTVAPVLSSIDDFDAEARRQSLLASAQDTDREILDFIEHVGDPRGWKESGESESRVSAYGAP